MARFRTWGRLVSGFSTLSLWSACALADPPPHPPYCEPRTANNVAANNIAPVPLGMVDNFSDDPAGLPLPPGQITPALAVDANGKQRSYKWGDATWLEPAENCHMVGQTFDYYPAVNAGNGNHPTIVYFHPNGANSHVEPGSPLDANLVQPAIHSGYNFITVEFRHPVTDQYLAVNNNNKVYHTDTGLAVQFFRKYAAKMNISKNNVFTFGYSRGTLALWQALQPDMGGPGTQLESSLPQAFFGFQAQTTYRCQEYADAFLLNDQYKQPEVQNCMDTNWAYAQFGSAYMSVNSTSLPVHLQYQQTFVLKTGTTDKIKLLSYPDLEASYEVEHYPDYGILLLNAYKGALNSRMEYPEQLIDYDHQFIGWKAFIDPKVTPDQP